MFVVKFPYDIGTFVRIKSNNSIGTVACYQCVSDGTDDDPDGQFMVMISGYRESWCCECLFNEIEPLTQEETKILNINNKKRK